MKKEEFILNAFFAIFCALFIKTSFAEPANLTHLKQEIRAYHDSGTYQKELKEVIGRAQVFLDKRANKNTQDSHPQKLAVILDIDETSLSNYTHIVARDFTGKSKKINHDMLIADAPAIQPMLSFYNDALKHGVTVFFVTGRKEFLQEATIKNLKFAGYHNWAGLYLKPNNYNQKSVIPFKSKIRADITRKGYTIIASIGDQYSDLNGGNAEKTFKLPNPYYYIP